MPINLADLVANLRLEDRDFAKGLARAEARLRDSKGRFVKVGTDVGSAAGKSTGKSFGDGLGGAIDALGGLIVARKVGQFFLGAKDAAVEFESAFAGVRKTVEASPAEFQAMEVAIREMATELPFAATEIAGVAEVAGQLGIAKENLLDFSKTALIIGETTNVAAEEAATAFAQIANVTRLPQGEIKNLAAEIVALGNVGASSEQAIIDFTQRISGAGTAVGISTPKIVGFAAALANVFPGAQAEAAGSAISRVFTLIDKSVATGSKELEGFARVAGVSIPAFAKLFREDATEATIRFIEGLKRIEDSGGDSIVTLDQLGLADLRVLDAIRRLIPGADDLRKTINLGTAEYEKGTAATDEFAKRLETNAAKLETLGNKFTETKIQIGGLVATGLIPILDFATKIPAPLVAAGAALAGLAASAIVFTHIQDRISKVMESLRDLGPAGAKAAGGLKALGKATAAAGVLYGLGQAASFAADKITDWLEGRQASPEAVERAILDIAAGVSAARPALEGFRVDIGRVDEQLAALVTKGKAEEARVAFEKLEATFKKMDLPGFLIPQFEKYKNALIGAENETRDTEAASGGLDEALGGLGGEAGEATDAFSLLEDALAKYNDELDKTLGVTLDAEEAADDLTEAKKDLAAQIKENGPIFKGNSDAALANREALRRVIEASEAYADALILSGKASVDSKPDILIASLKALADKYPALRTQIQKYIDKVIAADKLAITNPVSTPGMSAALANLDKLKAKLGDVGSLGISFYTNQAAGKAHGGPVSAKRPYIVGEEGPELFIPKVSGTIIPNNELVASAAAPVSHSETTTRNINVQIVNPRGETSEDSIHRQLRNLTYLGVL